MIDGQGNKWIGTWWGGLVKFDGVNWTVYNRSNSGLPNDYVHAVVIDGQGNKWVGTAGGGLVKFDSVNWTVYSSSNSGLPYNYVCAIAIDRQGNKWIGTAGGLSVYKEGGVILDVYEKGEIIPREFSLYQNYPNPFIPATVIEFDIAEVTDVRLEVYDVLGRKVKTILDERLEVGRYRVRFDGGDLVSGVYFYRLITDKFSSVKKMVLVK
ncbi:Por secretion system C-terminal sorting domain-containing protein [Candidatus Kryptonium thompsonii]|nr:Por secretion system C-terminal sorting domain-containing protein [Candidatus Kryptonium thompsoni]